MEKRLFDDDFTENHSKRLRTESPKEAPLLNLTAESTTRKFVGCSELSNYEISLFLLIYRRKNRRGDFWVYFVDFSEVSSAIHSKSKQIVALKKVLMHNEKEGVFLP